MNTGKSKKELSGSLTKIPKDFRDRITSSYVRIRERFFEGSFDSVGQQAGFFAETLLRFLQEELTGTHIAFGKKIPNFTQECRNLEKIPQASGHESLRIVIPRALDFLYTIRNKREFFGHVGEGLDANEVDATVCLRVADWCICELLRLYHSMSLEEAQALLDSIATRQLSGIWVVGGRKRILSSSLKYGEQVLLLLHGEHDSTALVEDLFEWIEHPDLHNFKRKVLEPLHSKRYVEFDEETQSVTISPLGIVRVEEEILPSLD